MENASKALIIAGAILISILIISFGVIILGQGSDVINNANMSDAEIAYFNSKFEAYEGEKVKGSKVQQMIKQVVANNRSAEDSSKQIGVMNYNPASMTTIPNASTIDGHATTIIKTSGEDGLCTDSTRKLHGIDLISAGSVYKVKCMYDPNSGLVKVICIQNA